jgi:hypothetical protein
LVEFVDKNASFSDIVGVVTTLTKDFFRKEIFLRSLRLFIENFDG